MFFGITFKDKVSMFFFTSKVAYNKAYSVFAEKMPKRGWKEEGNSTYPDIANVGERFLWAGFAKDVDNNIYHIASFLGGWQQKDEETRFQLIGLL